MSNNQRQKGGTSVLWTIAIVGLIAFGVHATSTATGASNNAISKAKPKAARSAPRAPAKPGQAPSLNDPPTALARKQIPNDRLRWMMGAAAHFKVRWQMVAGITWDETHHGFLPGPLHGLDKSLTAPNVNSFGCCAGVGQFNLRDGTGPRINIPCAGPGAWYNKGSTWSGAVTAGQADGSHDGCANPWDWRDSIWATAWKLSLDGAHIKSTLAATKAGEWAAAYKYNHLASYANRVTRKRDAYAKPSQGR
jgi:hypothetical protein